MFVTLGRSGFGHDKSLAILPYTQLNPRPTTFFYGDGVSDLSAAVHSDCLFVKDKGGENDLQDYCVRPFVSPGLALPHPATFADH